MKTILQWTDLPAGGLHTAWFGIIMLRVRLENDDQGNTSGYSVALISNKDRELGKLFQNLDNAKFAAERLLWNTVNEMYNELSQHTWDTYTDKSLEFKWVVR
jgi:hypothetical protein